MEKSYCDVSLVAFFGDVIMMTSLKFSSWRLLKIFVTKIMNFRHILAKIQPKNLKQFLAVRGNMRLGWLCPPLATSLLTPLCDITINHSSQLTYVLQHHKLFFSLYFIYLLFYLSQGSYLNLTKKGNITKRESWNMCRIHINSNRTKSNRL